MTRVITCEELDCKRDWKSSEKQSKANEELAEFNSLPKGTVEIDIVGNLVFEEVVRYKLEQIAKLILNKENGNEEAKNSEFDSYSAALKHLQ